MDRVQIISIVFSLILFSTVFNLVRRKRMKTEYSLIWLLVSVLFVVFSVWKNGIDLVAKLIGIVYPPSVLFIVLLVGIILILIEFSIIISKQAERIKVLVQEIGLMRQELDKVKKKQEEVKNEEHV